MEDLEAVSQIATRVTKRMCGEVGKLEAQLVSVRGWNAVQDELISKIADTAMDYQADLAAANNFNARQEAWNIYIDESNNRLSYAIIDLRDNINDLRADWAADHAVLMGEIKNQDVSLNFYDMTLQEFERDIESLTQERDRFGENIRDLKKEKYDIGMELEKLKKQNENLIEDLETARDRIKEMEENK